ncbi:hypothetical protein Dda_0322 [Drechslerella dactyloides]|uniref:SET domain-containing protein n=1 Tax=Drechslerella dactyloides TaxID=74499 RepID=A0AAD6J6D5_DREDA|nr:hypothetical protein Dda_0322 [Drechslerella dactyloides]
MPKRGAVAVAAADLLSPGLPDNHRRLVEHVLAGGARLAKVKVAQLPHGVGVVASQRIRSNEEITFIPTSLLVNLHDTPIPHSSPVDHPTTVHGSLAAYIASKARDGGDSFTAILPALASFRASMPLFWSAQVLEHCSPWVRTFALKQQAKLAADYDRAQRVHGDGGDSGLRFSREEFEWGWAVVNTRTIFYRPKRWAKVPAEDCMTMCPFIDYYNHDWRSEKTCLVSFSSDGLRVTTQKSYAPGEEIFVTYGDYNNDHLLVEYGFMLPHHGLDNVNIDAWVLPKLSPAKQDILAGLSFHGYVLPSFTPPRVQKIFHTDPLSDTMVVATVPLWQFRGDDSAYILDATSPCYRTLTALRLAAVDEALLPHEGKPGGERYGDFVRLVQGETDEDDYAQKYPAAEAHMSALMDGILREVRVSATEAMAALAGLTTEPGASAAAERWRQVIAILEARPT